MAQNRKYEIILRDGRNVEVIEQHLISALWKVTSENGLEGEDIVSITEIGLYSGKVIPFPNRHRNDEDGGVK
ncbi:hypothetical protein [Tumebacillus lipolyticus]|uniref:Uncharacterized protein n=1 Tax=Tumebacillus lipolyticus TaxID=1280370 RepID=A0ABW4ZUA1_9BACL